MAIEGINFGLLAVIAYPVAQGIVLIFFPKKARALYIWSKEVVGIEVNPKSPMLSDTSLQFWGIASLIVALLVALIAWFMGAS
jgi:hypothetical protein